MTRVTNFVDLDSTLVTLRTKVTRLEWRFSQVDSTRVTVNDLRTARNQRWVRHRCGLRPEFAF